jgi:4-amino-4-deoxychorismate lyase
MYQLVESVRIENRQLHHIELHNQRLNRAMESVYGISAKISLEKIIEIPDNLTINRYKCRVTISFENTVVVSIDPYIQREIKTLKVVHDNDIEYPFKTENRLELNACYEKREGCDDIIIVKNGLITDSWAANILLFDGKSWIAPDTPLLKGVQREYLLTQNLIKSERVTINDLPLFKKIRLVNAMIDFERAPEIEINGGVIF